jgi:Family of unknown function (DUF5683)
MHLLIKPRSASWRRAMKMLQDSNSHFNKKAPLLVLLMLCCAVAFAQRIETLPATKKDSTPAAIKKATVNKYDSATKAHSPRAAALRSAILPGWGQIYNKKYWKVPIVYGALGTCAGIFFYNLGYYKDTRFAYTVKYNMRVFGTDSALYTKIKSNLKPLSEESLRTYRNQFRRDVDYSTLIFIILWGLNVVDATVDAHLKSFDVSPDLSLQIKPGHSQMAGTNGMSLILTIGKNHSR